MRLLGVFILIFFVKTSYGQDTIPKMKLKPISQFPLPYLTADEEARIKDEKKIDSLNNSDICKKKRLEYGVLCEKNREEIMTMEKKVKELNEQNKNSCYLYFILYDCQGKLFDWKGCGSYYTLSSRCDYYDLKIDKKEKSRLILDGLSGEVFYYEDIKHMPR